MVKKYSKQSNSLSNTKRGGVDLPHGLDDKLIPAEDAAVKILINLTEIKPDATLDTIKKLEILKDFNTKFIGYLREKANETVDAAAFKLLFGKTNNDKIEDTDKINDLLYSRLINNNDDLPTNNQINILKQNEKLIQKNLFKTKLNSGPSNSGIIKKNNAGQSVINNVEVKLRQGIQNKINTIDRYTKKNNNNKKYEELKNRFKSTLSGNKISPSKRVIANQIFTELKNLDNKIKPARPPPPPPPKPPPPPQAAAQTAQTAAQAAAPAPGTAAQTAVSGGKKSTSSKKKSTSSKKKSTSTSTKKKSTSTSTKKKSTSTSSKKKSTKK